MKRAQASLPPLLQSPTGSNASSSSGSAVHNTSLQSTKHRLLSSRQRPVTLIIMPSLPLLLMFFSLSLATSCCEGRAASFLHSKMDTGKVKGRSPSNLTLMVKAATAEKVDHVTASGMKSINHWSHRKEHNSRREKSPAYYVQESDLVAALQHEPQSSTSEEQKPEFHLDYEDPKVHTPSHN